MQDILDKVIDGVLFFSYGFFFVKYFENKQRMKVIKFLANWSNKCGVYLDFNSLEIKISRYNTCASFLGSENNFKYEFIMNQKYGWFNRSLEPDLELTSKTLIN